MPLLRVKRTLLGLLALGGGQAAADQAGAASSSRRAAGLLLDKLRHITSTTSTKRTSTEEGYNYESEIGNHNLSSNLTTFVSNVSIRSGRLSGCLFPTSNIKNYAEVMLLHQEQAVALCQAGDKVAAERMA